MARASRVFLMVLKSITIHMCNARGQMEEDGMFHLRVYVLYPWHPPHVQLCFFRSAVDMWGALKSTGQRWRGPSPLLSSDCFCMSQSLQDIRTPFTAVAAPSICKRLFACFFIHGTKFHQSPASCMDFSAEQWHLHGQVLSWHWTNHLHQIRNSRIRSVVANEAKSFLCGHSFFRIQCIPTFIVFCTHLSYCPFPIMWNIHPRQTEKQAQLKTSIIFGSLQSHAETLTNQKCHHLKLGTLWHLQWRYLSTLVSCSRLFITARAPTPPEKPFWWP